MRPADEVVLRYRYIDGSIQAAIPMRIVEHTGDRVVAWLSPETEIMYWAMADGRDPRGVPLAERFSNQLGTAPRRWRGSGVLRVFLAGRPFEVLHFWNVDGTFSGWYVNFETPFQLVAKAIESRDWHLDLWVAADGTSVWKDEDEAEVAAAHGHVLEHELGLARETGERIVADTASLLVDAGDWRTFRPPVGWGALSLPADWRTC